MKFESKLSKDTYKKMNGLGESPEAGYTNQKLDADARRVRRSSSIILQEKSRAKPKAK